ncbi:MAG: hypothetical protein CMF55_02730 [Legionellales bacterium]|nr:hypothetical protein [Legionellales bacterium]
MLDFNSTNPVVDEKEPVFATKQGVAGAKGSSSSFDDIEQGSKGSIRSGKTDKDRSDSPTSDPGTDDGWRIGTGSPINCSSEGSSSPISLPLPGVPDSPWVNRLKFVGLLDSDSNEIIPSDVILRCASSAAALFMTYLYFKLTWEKESDSSPYIIWPSSVLSGLVNGGLYESSMRKFGQLIAFDGLSDDYHEFWKNKSRPARIGSLVLFSIGASLPAMPLYAACDSLNLPLYLSLSALLFRTLTTAMALPEFLTIMRSFFNSEVQDDQSGYAAWSSTFIKGLPLQETLTICFDIAASLFLLICAIWYSLIQHAPISSGFKSFFDGYGSLGSYRYGIEAIGVLAVMPFNMYYVREGWYYLKPLMMALLATPVLAAQVIFKPVGALYSYYAIYNAVPNTEGTLQDSLLDPLMIEVDDSPSDRSRLMKVFVVLMVCAVTGAPALAMADASNNDSDSTMFAGEADLHSLLFWDPLIVGALMNIGSFSKNIEKSPTGVVTQMMRMPSTLASWSSTPREPSFSTFFGSPVGEGGNDKRPQQAGYSQLDV